MYLNIFSRKLMNVFIHYLLFNYFTDAIINSYVPKEKRYVVMTRHGETDWSRDDIFCGWYDSPLTADGRREAKKCAKLFNLSKFKFDKAFTSVLSRAEETLKIILQNINQPNIEIQQSWRLNERHYGALTGQFKNKVDPEKVEIWRRSYDVLPPEMKRDHPCYIAIHTNQKIVNSLKADKAVFPTTESLETTKARVAPYWEGVIKPAIQEGNSVLIVAHGTVLKALIMLIEDLSKEAICGYELPTAAPFVYEFKENMELLQQKVFLGDQKKIEERMKENRKIKGCPNKE